MRRRLLLAAALTVLMAIAGPAPAGPRILGGGGGATISAPNANIGSTVTVSNLPAGATVQWMCDQTVQTGQTGLTFVIPSGCASAALVTARITLASAVGPVPALPGGTFDLSVPGNGTALLILF